MSEFASTSCPALPVNNMGEAGQLRLDKALPSTHRNGTPRIKALPIPFLNFVVLILAVNAITVHAFLQTSQMCKFGTQPQYQETLLFAKNEPNVYTETLGNTPNASRGLNELQIVNNEIRKKMLAKDINWNAILVLTNHMITNADCNNKGEERIVNDAFRHITNYAFASSSWENIRSGLIIMELQAKITSIPRPVCLQALKALNVLMKRRKGKKEERVLQAKAAYRILQRMCTGKGISHQGNSKVQVALDERDFCMVLNGFVNIGKMDMAHRIVALQVRTKHAPPLSPVTYSILIKGFGSLKDIASLDQVLEHAEKNGVYPDTIMYNSMMDAYINCDDVPKAYTLFQDLTKPRSGLQEQESPFPSANVRTYNTMLKGFAKAQNMEKALMLSKDMEEAKMWDSVTTNTLVGVAIATNHFDMAESILEKYTTEPKQKDSRRNSRWHPNVEAYTELIGGYARIGNLNKATETFKTMRHRGVDPNEFTYTSIIGGLAKAGKIAQAKNLLSFMAKNDGIPPSVVTYNALFAGMLKKTNVKGETDNYEEDEAYNELVNEALRLLGVMVNAEVYPNAVTISTLVGGLGQCKPHRVEEAKALVERMDADGFVSENNLKVATNLIRAHASSSDLEGALQVYRRIPKPDVIAFNALLNTFCECGRIKMAIEILHDNLKKKKDQKKDVNYIIPDTATFTILISSLLAIGTEAASKASLKLYIQMKDQWEIAPDAGLVDAILTPMVSGGNALGLHDTDAIFTKEVLSDAKKLEWPKGFFERREKIVKSVFSSRISEVWKENDEVKDPLFKKKNWNTIDSGFRLWGDFTTKPRAKAKPKKDEFLESKKWNDIDSSFRIL